MLQASRSFRDNRDNSFPRGQISLWAGRWAESPAFSDGEGEGEGNMIGREVRVPLPLLARLVVLVAGVFPAVWEIRARHRLLRGLINHCSVLNDHEPCKTRFLLFFSRGAHARPGNSGLSCLTRLSRFSKRNMARHTCRYFKARR